MARTYPDGRAELRDAALSQFRSSLQLSELTVALLEFRRPAQNVQTARARFLRRRAAGRHRGQPAAS